MSQLRIINDEFKNSIESVIIPLKGIYKRCTVPMKLYNTAMQKIKEVIITTLYKNPIYAFCALHHTKELFKISLYGRILSL